jgi:ribosomal protein S18 acetylase RimI-like enzyme
MARTDDAELIRLGGPSTLERFEEIQQVYVEAFPSYDLDDHRWRTSRQAGSPGFGTVIAQISGRIVGFIYGFSLAQDTNWWNGLKPAPQPGFTRETGSRTCAVIDLAVRPTHRGQGLARRLMTDFLNSRAEERATLATNPRERTVQAMYERWGWHKVGATPGGEHETETEFDLYVISLRDGEETTSSR